MTNPKGEDFRKYRDIAPEGVDDEAIMSLIKKSAGSHAAITAAIENMWHDLPDGKAVGGRDEWNTTSKSKSKKDVIAVQQVSDRGGRGGRAGQSGGRGQGAGGRGGGDRVVGRGAGISGTGRNTNPPRPAAVQPAQGSQSAGPAVIPDQSDAPTPVSVPVASSVAATAPPASTGSTGWGSGGKTLAEKLKQAEIQKLAPPAVPEVSANGAAVSEEAVVPEVQADRGPRRPRGRNAGHAPVAAVEPKVEPEIVPVKSADQEHVQELITEVIELAVSEPVLEVQAESKVIISSPAVVESVVIKVPDVIRIEKVEVIEPIAAPVEVIAVVPTPAPKAFLKMGKWEAPMESSAFQFGSFGNYSSSTTSEDAISLAAKASWGAVTVTESADLLQHQPQSEATTTWGTNGTTASDAASSGSSPITSLYPSQKGLPATPSDGSPSGPSSSSHSGRYDQQKPLAPPGLEAQQSIPKSTPRQDSRSTGQSQNRAKYDVSQQQQTQQQQQQYQQTQYQQQSTATPPATSRGQVPAAPSMMYGYAPGFDIQSQYQQSTYGQQAPAAAATSVGSSPPAAGAASAQTQGQGQEIPAGAPQALQYAPPPGMSNHYVNPYYGPPYYGSQYFYGQPIVPNPYYSQGRGDYQSQGRYGSDPYVPGGQYPNVYHQGGGFADPMAMQQQQQHTSMAQQSHGQGQSGAAASTAPASGQGKQQKGASVAAAAPQHVDPNQGYPYNPYNSREGQWGYQGWNAPMMGFPGGSPSGSLGPQGFAQQPPQQQSAQGQGQGQGQRPPSTGYGQAPAQQQQQQQQQGQGQGQGPQSYPRGAPANPAAPSGGNPGQHW